MADRPGLDKYIPNSGNPNTYHIKGSIYANSVRFRHHDEEGTANDLWVDLRPFRTVPPENEEDEPTIDPDWRLNQVKLTRGAGSEWEITTPATGVSYTGTPGG
jgi:hypothetical protein